MTMFAGVSNYSEKEITEIARVCQLRHKEYCERLGDTSQGRWNEIPEWHRESVIKGVKVALDGGTPPELHESWVQTRVAQGWKYGKVKDTENKIHPDLVDFGKLPKREQEKSRIFVNTVREMAALIQDRRRRGG